MKLFSAEAKNPVSSGSLPLLHVCWFQLMHLIGNPAAIISFDPRAADAFPSNPLSAILASGNTLFIYSNLYSKLPPCVSKAETLVYGSNSKRF